MVFGIVLWEHSPLLQNLSALSSVALLVLGVLIARLLVNANWDIVTSRIFLEKDAFRVFMKKFLILTVLYASSIGMADLIELLDFSGIYLIADAFALLARVSILTAVYLLYSTLKELAGMEDEEKRME